MRAHRQSGEIITVILLALAAIAAIYGGYKLVGLAADALASHVPDELETTLFGDLGSKESDWTSKADTDARQRAAKIFEKLTRQKDLRDLKYRLYFIDDETPNAFALPGGNVAVTDGLLELVEGEIGLAMVLGHELGHQQLRHSLQSLGRGLIVAGLVLPFVGNSGFLVNIILEMAENSHSREQELDADAYGLKMVHEVYGTTEGAEEFFIKIGDDEDDIRLLAMLSTHPYTPDRIKELEALQRRLESGDP